MYHLLIHALDKKPDSFVELIEYNERYYVLKSFVKEKLLENEAKANQAVNERDLLKLLSHPTLNRLVTTTKDPVRVCLVLELAEGVDLVALLRVYKRIPAALVKIVAAQVR